MDIATQRDSTEVKSLSSNFPGQEPNNFQEGVQKIVKANGQAYSVREHRMVSFMPDLWLKFYNSLRSPKAKLTAQLLIQTGARINEVRHIRKDDLDFERNTIRLRITKTKAIKGEKKGKPRTIPVNSAFMKQLRKVFSDKQNDELIGILSTPAMHLAIKRNLEIIGVADYYMYSIHNIRKTHGNWLKILGNAGVMKVDAAEICLRLGHDMDTFIKAYGSSGEFNHKDILLAKEILGDLYAR